MKVCEVCGARFRGNPSTCPLDGGNLVPLPDPLVGRTIAGRYLVTERIGAGGMGMVYRAKHEVVGRDVALKFLSPDLAYEPTNKTRFLREARAANRINHEHIIDITDYGETDDGLVYLVMEYLRGMPLNEEIGQGPLPIDRAINITLQCAQALARAHELDVVHRDIKPDNIYLLEGYDEDFVKILDFGLAHMKGELRVTATGTVFGTPEYMSPEQARGAPITPSADLYSLGCVLFEMLTGHLPFQGSTPDLILKHLREPPRAPSFYLPNIPREIDEVVLQLMEKDPADRIPSAFELAELLKDWLEKNRGSLPPVTPRVPVNDEAGDERDTHPSVSAIVARWEDRVEVFRRLVERAHPDGATPEWLPAAIEGLASEVHALTRLRDKLTERVTIAISQEEEVRQTRMRLGHAIDALAADDSRIARSVAEAEARLEEAKARRGQVTQPLVAAWKKIPPHREGPIEDPTVRAIAEAGALAKIRLDAERAVEELEKRLAVLASQKDDLDFQIGQLKGRMGGLSAATDVDLDDLRRQTQALDSELQERLDEVVRKSEPVVRHFMAFPHLRDVVRGTHAEGAIPVDR